MPCNLHFHFVFQRVIQITGPKHGKHGELLLILHSELLAHITFGKILAVIGGFLEILIGRKRSNILLNQSLHFVHIEITGYYKCEIRGVGKSLFIYL